MITNEIIEKLLPHLREVIPREEWYHIPELFQKVYHMRYNEEHDSYVLGYWDRELPAVAFDTRTGNFLGVVMPEYVRVHGVLL